MELVHYPTKALQDELARREKELETHRKWNHCNVTRENGFEHIDFALKSGNHAITMEAGGQLNFTHVKTHYVPDDESARYEIIVLDKTDMDKLIEALQMARTIQPL